MPEQTNRLPVAARREMDGVVWVRASDYAKALECIADLEAELAHEKAEHAETVDDYRNACRLRDKAEALLEAATVVRNSIATSIRQHPSPGSDSERWQSRLRDRLDAAIAKALGEVDGGGS